MKKVIMACIVFIITILVIFPIPIKTYQGRNTYQLMSNGSYECLDYNYKYKLELTGIGHGATKTTTFIVLSNNKNITFEEAWTAKWTSVSLTGFDPDEAVIVDIIF